MAQTIDFRSNLSESESPDQQFSVIYSPDCYMNCYMTALQLPGLDYLPPVPTLSEEIA
jgi:hypothetical protein